MFSEKALSLFNTKCTYLCMYTCVSVKFVFEMTGFQIEWKLSQIEMKT